jgi:hypothetical protein
MLCNKGDTKMGFKEYLNESLLVEAKVKVGGKEYASKKDAGIALAKLGKNAEQIEKATGLSLAGAKWCIAQVKKGGNEPLKAQNQKMTMLDKLKIELKRAEDELKKLGKRGGVENDAYILTLKKKIKDNENSTRKDEPVYKGSAPSGDLHLFNQKLQGKTHKQIADMLASHNNEIAKSNEAFKMRGFKHDPKDDIHQRLAERNFLQKVEQAMRPKKEDKEPVKNKAQERREALEAYKKGEKHKPEALELAPLDRNKSKTKAKEWMKKHGDDHNKQKELKAVRKEMEILGDKIDELEGKERTERVRGNISSANIFNALLKKEEEKMRRLLSKEQDLIG